MLESGSEVQVPSVWVQRPAYFTFWYVGLDCFVSLFCYVNYYKQTSSTGSYVFIM